jgi:small subunit ribosomal protein S1
MVLKIDEERQNIVVSRRAVIEKERAEKATVLLTQLHEGEIRKGIVKNITDYGAFVDLGGIEGLLHINDMSWERINHPSEIVQFGDEIDVVILSVNREEKRIPLGLKQVAEIEAKNSAWSTIEERYYEGMRVKGKVVKLMNYEALVELEKGMLGAVHVSEMSWMKKVAEPSKVLEVGRIIEVTILQIDKEQRKITLGLTPLHEGEIRKGIVTNITDFEAFVDLGGIDGLLHMRDMSWERINHPSEKVQLGDEIECVILRINKENKIITLGLKQKEPGPWEHVDDKYPVGKMITGIVKNLVKYGAFIVIEDGIEGLLHISNLSWTRKITYPTQMLTKGQEISCKVLSVDKEHNRISLGLKQLEEDPWEKQIPEKYKPGLFAKGTVVRVTKFGVFVSLEDDLEGLIHKSEMADHEAVNVGDEIEVKVSRVEIENRKIGLTRKLEWTPEEATEAVVEGQD